MFIDFSKPFYSIHRGKIEQILLAYSFTKETVTTLMMFYKNTNAIVCSPNGDTDFFNIVAGILQGEILAPYMFIVNQDYILQKINKSNKRKWFHIKRSRWCPIEMIDTNYADDLVLLTNTPVRAKSQLHSLGQAVGGIGFYVNANKTD